MMICFSVHRLQLRVKSNDEMIDLLAKRLMELMFIEQLKHEEVTSFLDHLIISRLSLDYLISSYYLRLSHFSSCLRSFSTESLNSPNASM